MDLKKLRLVLIVVVLLGLGGWAAYRYLPTRGSHDAALESARQVYLQGEQALAANDGETALGHFNRALEQIIRLQGRIDAPFKKKAPTKDQVESLREMQAKVYWLRARCLRDVAFAQALKDGQPLEATLDTSTGERYRNFLASPDARSRSDAVLLLRNAVNMLPDNEELLTDSLRVELQMQPVSWSGVAALAKKINERQPKNARALYLLARYELEQPDVNGGAPAPSAKRDAVRLAKAEQHLQALKATGELPWRTSYLEAQILQGKVEQAVRDRDSARIAAARDAWERWMWPESAGVLEDAAALKQMERMSPWDTEAVVALFRMAHESLATTTEKGEAANRRLQRVVENYCVFAKGQLARKDSVFSADLLLDETMERMKLAAGRTGPSDALAGKARDVFREALRQPLGKPRHFVRWTEWLQDAGLSSASAEAGQTYLREARVWLDDCAKAFGASKSSEDLAPLHAALAFSLLREGAPRAALTPHLKGMQAAVAPEAVFQRHLIEGAVELREGNLDRAQDHFDQLHRVGRAEQALRANLASARQLVAQGKPDKALPYLRQIHEDIAAWNQCSLSEKLWFRHLVGTEDQLRFLLIQTQLDMITQKLARQTDNQNRGIPTDQMRHYAAEADGWFRKIAPTAPQRLWARQVKIQSLAQQRQLDQAQQEFRELRREAPQRAVTWATALWLRENTATDDAQVKECVDEMIANCTKSGELRLLTSLWNARNQQAPRAAALLADLPAALDDAGMGAGLPVEHLTTLGGLCRDNAQPKLWTIYRDLLTTALQRSPDDALLHLWLGVAQLELKQSDEARASLQHAATLARQRYSATAAGLRGNVLREAEIHLTRLP
jgi:hypothetical protein